MNDDIRADVARALREAHSKFLADNPSVYSVRSCVTAPGFEEINVMTTRRKPGQMHWEPTP